MDQVLGYSPVRISFSWLRLRNKAFPNSYVLIIIAHAGATLISLGIKPEDERDRESQRCPLRHLVVVVIGVAQY